MSLATLDENWKLITDLTSFSKGETNIPPTLPGLSPEGQDLLATDEGKKAVISWLVVFDETISIVKHCMSEPSERRKGEGALQVVTGKVIAALVGRFENPIFKRSIA